MCYLQTLKIQDSPEIGMLAVVCIKSLFSKKNFLKFVKTVVNRINPMCFMHILFFFKEKLFKNQEEIESQ